MFSPPCALDSGIVMKYLPYAKNGQATNFPAAILNEEKEETMSTLMKANGLDGA